jgi:glycosyltransferase involved in cell wall biosynthesis
MGGIADYTAALCGALEAQGNSVTVVTAQPNASSARAIRVPGWRLRSIDDVARRISEADTDIVHLQYQAAAFEMSGAIALLPIALRRLGTKVPFVTTLHDLRAPHLFPKAGPLRRAVLGMVLGMSAASIFVDPGDLAAAHPRRVAAWIPVGSAISPILRADQASERARLGIDPDSFVIAHFGFLNAGKGIDVLLDAAERLVRAELHLTLLFVGDEVGSSDSTNASTARSLWTRATELGLDARIVRTGALPPADVARALAAADIAALPFRDGASLRHSSLLACLAQGLPTATTLPRYASAVARRHLVPPFTESTQSSIDGRVAELTPPGDAPALARSMYRLANDPPRREALARAGRELAEVYNWTNIARATVGVYERAISGG